MEKKQNHWGSVIGKFIVWNMIGTVVLLCGLSVWASGPWTKASKIAKAIRVPCQGSAWKPSEKVFVSHEETCDSFLGGYVFVKFPGSNGDSHRNSMGSVFSVPPFGKSQANYLAWRFGVLVRSLVRFWRVDTIK